MEKNIRYINALDQNASQQFEEVFFSLLPTAPEAFTEFVILCIGTDRATGDSLGPITGYLLESSLARESVSIFGTLERPVHAKNILQTVNYISAVCEHPFITAIDACLGKPESVGYITIGQGPISPGAGLCKDLPAVGHISITGIVNVASGMDFAILQNTRLNLVMKMARVIHDGIVSGWENFQKSIVDGDKISYSIG